MPNFHLSKLREEVKTIEYVRKPTEYEIKFGLGAMHYREFDLSECVDENGFLKRFIVAGNDGLRYKRY